MKRRILIDSFTFEVARTVDTDLSKRIGHGFSSNTDWRRLVAVLLALEDSGSLPSEDQGSATLFTSGAEEAALRRLPEFLGVPEDSFDRALEYVISIELSRSEKLHSVELFRQYRANLDESLVESSWDHIGEVVRLVVVEGRLRLVGPELQNGLIFKDCIRSTTREEQYVWFSLGDHTNKKPFMVDLEKPEFHKGRFVRSDIKASASVQGSGRSFVTLMP
jgi:hypothetical protein